VTLDPLAGYVVVLAGDAAVQGAELLRRGVLLAVVTTDPAAVRALELVAADSPTAMLLAYRADPGDPATWERLAPHIEQRVGPVDAVVCDRPALDVVRSTFEADLRRRGHGDVVPLTDEADLVSTVDRLLHHRR